MNLSIHRVMVAALMVAAAIPAWAVQERVNQIPNGTRISCSACHVSPQGGGARNRFGMLVERNFLQNGRVVWGPLLASLDADGDGVSNGVELQDPYGQWVANQPNPGIPGQVTNPGTAASHFLRTLNLQFSGMDPHIGQLLSLRVIDLTSSQEVHRASQMITTGTFDLSYPVLLYGRSYSVEFFADVNGNGLYDAPPTDHAWSLPTDLVTGDTGVPFSHNTDFVDIGWTYAVNVSLAGMSPHMNQLVEYRVVDTATDEEMGRARTDVVSTANYTVTMPGLAANGSYRVDFYADLNRNGRYDAPPTDHAWSLPFANPEGYAALDFAHNTNFTDVQWKYLYTLNMLGMTPHLGQLVRMRVMTEDGSTEIGRDRVANLATANSSLQVPGIDRNTSYRADLCADLNLNGRYDAPPVDHAWRLTFNNPTGNVVQNFTHNTGFTDIQWPEANAIDPDALAVLPDGHRLEQNFPNPFNPTTQIRFALPAAGLATLKVYDLTGREVATLVNGTLAAGEHTAEWRPDGLSSGVYFYRLTAGSFTDAKRLILMK